MKQMVAFCLAATVIAASVSSAFAADDTGTKKKKKADAGANAQVFKLPDTVQLTPEQQEKLDALKKEHGPKVAELQKKADDVLTPEQKAARKDALAKAKTDQVKGKAQREAVMTALNLTPEQKTKWDAAQAEVKAYNATVRGKIGELLTDEQKASIPEFSGGKKKKKNKNAN